MRVGESSGRWRARVRVGGGGMQGRDPGDLGRSVRRSTGDNGGVVDVAFGPHRVNTMAVRLTATKPTTAPHRSIDCRWNLSLIMPIGIASATWVSPCTPEMKPTSCRPNPRWMQTVGSGLVAAAAGGSDGQREHALCSLGGLGLLAPPSPHHDHNHAPKPVDCCCYSSIRRVNSTGERHKKCTEDQ